MTNTDVVVIGSGIGGLCCAALLARYGYGVIVCESHNIPGGAAHGFQRQGYHFDSGPSLYSGLSSRHSPNPLRHVLNAIGEDATWLTYDAWGVDIPEGTFSAPVGAQPFGEILSRLRGESAATEWQQLQAKMIPLGQAATALPPAAMRWDWQAWRTLLPHAGTLLRRGRQMQRLSAPYSTILDRHIHDPFTRNWLDLLCFLLSGFPASGTNSAEMAFMFAEWYRPGVKLDYPIGGSAALVAALNRGLNKYGGEIRLNAHVEEILVENQQAIGVRLRSGETIQASRAVVSNAVIWDTLHLMPDQVLPTSFRQQRQATPACESFMHLHLGVDATNIRPDLECHYIVVNDWQRGVTAPQNVVVMSIPSVLDPQLAPPGKHVLHVYTPATEPYAVWQGLNRHSQAYADLKQQRAAIMWQSLEKIIPDIRERVEVELVGTPLTHQRFLRRYRGSYGPAISAANGLFPSPKMPVKNLWCVGDSTFPGIGLPAVAASGTMIANTIATVSQHRQLIPQMLGC